MYPYKNTQHNLRYGHVLIMTDQDHDGSHIKGLIINFFHHYWPSLLENQGFLQQFITPILKATINKGNILAFYSIQEYEKWRIQNNNLKYHIKYYKGLGTNTAEEGKVSYPSPREQFLHLALTLPKFLNIVMKF
jgi:DNA topoisomerase-2